jgi:hypothetical protein
VLLRRLTLEMTTGQLLFQRSYRLNHNVSALTWHNNEARCVMTIVYYLQTARATRVRDPRAAMAPMSSCEATTLSSRNNLENRATERGLQSSELSEATDRKRRFASARKEAAGGGTKRNLPVS